MKVAIVTSLLAKWNMEINTRHHAKIKIRCILVGPYEVMNRLVKTLFFVSGAILSGCSGGTANEEWHTFTGTNEGMRYVEHGDITTDNVNQLTIAWEYDTGDSVGKGSTIPTTPLMVDGVLYGVSPNQHLFALDARSGKEHWVFKAPDSTARGSIRSISFWQDKSGREKRLFYATGPKLYAVDATTGKGIATFGDGGCIDLRRNLDGPYESSWMAGNTAPTVYKDLLITGMRLSEGADAAPGHIRAFDVRTGKRQWIFHTIPHPGEKGYETWEDPDAWKHIGGANNWAGMAIDENRGIVYIPLGSSTPDFYGKRRKGQNLFANCLLALDANTGRYLWHFQTVHHDLWDRDLPAYPNLVTVRRNGRWVDAVAQITKSGHIFLFDRVTGTPLFPIEEVPAPSSDLPGEEAWPTQPVPTLPEPFARQHFGADDVSDRTPEIHRELLDEYHRYRNDDRFLPPSLQGSWLFPGFDGGGQWSGAAVDPETQILYVGSSELPWRLQMIANPALKEEKAKTLKEQGSLVYRKACASCHGSDRQGIAPSFPELAHLPDRMTVQQAKLVIENGRNMMPAFKDVLDEGEKTALLTYLMDLEDKEAIPKAANASMVADRSSQPEYILNGYQRFLDRDGYPGIKPPWGTLNAVDLTSGKLLWKVPLGNFDELGTPEDTGTEVYGGPVVTKSGLIFIAGTQDEKIRAFDKKTGDLLWQHRLPAAGFASPAVYTLEGKQFVVIAAGGGKLGMPSGTTYIAFALPDHP